jgi:hypothetical protein
MTTSIRACVGHDDPVRQWHLLLALSSARAAWYDRAVYVRLSSLIQDLDPTSE